MFPAPTRPEGTCPVSVPRASLLRALTHAWRPSSLPDGLGGRQRAERGRLSPRRAGTRVSEGRVRLPAQQMSVCRLVCALGHRGDAHAGAGRRGPAQRPRPEGGARPVVPAPLRLPLGVCASCWTQEAPGEGRRDRQGRSPVLGPETPEPQAAASWGTGPPAPPGPHRGPLPGRLPRPQ